MIRAIACHGYWHVRAFCGRCGQLVACRMQQYDPVLRDQRLTREQAVAPVRSWIEERGWTGKDGLPLCHGCCS
jgi:hypothetical protein